MGPALWELITQKLPWEFALVAAVLLVLWEGGKRVWTWYRRAQMTEKEAEAALQEHVNERLQTYMDARDRRIDSLERRLEAKDERIDHLTSRVDHLEEELESERQLRKEYEQLLKDHDVIDGEHRHERVNPTTRER